MHVKTSKYLSRYKVFAYFSCLFHLIASYGTVKESNSIEEKTYQAENSTKTNEAQFKEKPKSGQYFYRLGRDWAKKEVWDKAIDAYSQALEFMPGDPDTQVSLGYALLSQNNSRENLEKSQKLFEETLKNHPGETDAQGGLKTIQLLLNIKQKEEALLQVQKSEVKSTEFIAKKKPDSGEYFYKLGRAYAKIEAWDKAIDAYKKALELIPEDPDTEVSLGYALLFQNNSKENLDQSERLFQHVLKNIPHYVDAQEGIKQVQALSQMKEKKEILPEVQKIEVKPTEFIAKEKPDSGEYFYKLGRTHAKAEAWDKAIDAYKKALELMPEDPDTEVSLGYALLFQNNSKENLDQSERLFQHVLKNTPHYVDAQEGIKQIQALSQMKEKKEMLPEVQKIEVKPTEFIAKEKPDSGEYFYKLGRTYAKAEAWDKAIDAYKKSLELMPEDPDTEVSMGYAILAEYDSRESLKQGAELFQKVLKDHPDYVDAQEGLKRILAVLNKDEKKENNEIKREKVREWADLKQSEANLLSKEGCHEGAVKVYLELIEAHPDNPQYFFNLGNEYSKMEKHSLAIEAFEKAVFLKSDYTEAAVALGKQYWLIHNYCLAKESFESALEQNPHDVNALINAAGLEAELLNFSAAENYYLTALDIDPQNITVIKPYAYFLYNQQRFQEAEYDYRYLADQDTNPDANKAMLFDISSYTTPTFFTTGGATEEREKDIFSKTSVAAIHYINSEAGFIFPLKERFRLTAKGRIGITRQLLLSSKLTQFDVKYDAGGLKGEWFYGPYWIFVADVFVEHISNNDPTALLPVKKRFLLEPSIMFRYLKGPHRLSFGVTTDSFIYRNFAKVRLDVDTRETVVLGYQHDFGNTRLAGVDAAWAWYQDPVNNQEQDLNLWAQTAIPFVEDTTSLRFHSEYRHFYHTVSGYYSFQYQLTNWLKLRFFKIWKDTYQCELLYWHGWRITRGRNPQQQIIVLPSPTLIPFTTVENQIDQLFLNLIYTPRVYCSVSLNGFYYHDSFDYTAYGAKIHLDWRF